MTAEATNSIGSDSPKDLEGDVISGVSETEDGPPTPTGSIPPGPAGLDSDDLVNPEELPPLGERMF